VTEYVAGGSTPVVHAAAPELTEPEQSVDPPALKVTVPVAPDGSPDAESPTVLPKLVLDGLVDAVKDVVAWMMVKLVVASEPV
jgi:hypothetical protein